MSRITLSDRAAIEAGIYGRKTLTEIANAINKSPRCVSEEIKRNGTKVPGLHPLGKKCRNAGGCRRVGLCEKEECSKRCWQCSELDCQTVCPAFWNDPCRYLQKPPYVCNVCDQRRKCKLDRVYYIVSQADALAQKRYAAARSKPQCRGEELEALNALVTPLIQKGQPLTHICATHRAELSVSQRTLYNYIDAGILDVKNLDLRRKTGYRPRRKQHQSSESFLNQKWRKDRTYEDFVRYLEKHPDTAYVEMDTVRGAEKKESGC